MSTIKDVARIAGVSVATVSAVVNGNRPVSKPLEARVKEAIAELDYRPNLIARALYTKRTNTFALLVPSLDNPFFARLLRSVEDEALRHGFSVFVGSTDGEPGRVEAYKDHLLALGIDGILTTLSWEVVSSSLISDCLSRGVPVVGVSSARVVEGVDCFVADDQEGAAAVARYLLRLGHREIAFLGVKDSQSTRLRLDGLRDALCQAGTDLNVSLEVLVEGYSEDHAYDGIVELLSRNLSFTAVVTFNDVMALGAMNALEDQGIAVPGDVSVVGFDNTVAKYIRPKLTTVSFPVEELGAAAVKRLTERVAGDKTPPRVHTLPTRLFVQQSTRARGPFCETP